MGCTLLCGRNGRNVSIGTLVVVYPADSYGAGLYCPRLLLLLVSSDLHIWTLSPQYVAILYPLHTVEYQKRIASSTTAPQDAQAILAGHLAVNVFASPLLPPSFHPLRMFPNSNLDTWVVSCVPCCLQYILPPAYRRVGLTMGALQFVQFLDPHAEREQWQ